MGIFQGVVSRPLGKLVAHGLIVLITVVLRGYHLGSPPLWVEEAESSLNALTIVADGVPGDHFLGQPIYENTLVRPWPGNPEYEFRDLSYSDRGLAIYHGWLPLYSIAAAFRLAGVTPEAARRGTPPRDASLSEIRRWTAVPRLPTLVFSALFVIAAWGLGRSVHSAPAGWSLAFAAATSNYFVWVGRQARYYSATTAGNAVCGLAIWHACRRGRVADHALAGVAVGVLFHIHSVSALTMVALYAAAFPLWRRQPQLWLRILTAGAASGLLVLPWAVWSGWLGQRAWIPAARHYLDVPMLLWSLPITNPTVLITAGLGLTWLGVASLLIDRVNDRWTRPFVDKAAAFYFATVWLALTYLVFVTLVPAASYFIERLKLVVAVPGLLVTALVITSTSRTLRPSSRLLPVTAMIFMLVLAGQIPPKVMFDDTDASDRRFADLVGLIRSWTLGAGGRMFASPNDHLVLTYYSGRPVQNIAPVRKEWLDRFASDLIVIEGGGFLTPNPSEVQVTARGVGIELTAAEAKSRAIDAVWLATALHLTASGSSVVPPPRMADTLDRALVHLVQDSTRRQMIRLVRGTPLARFSTPSDVWEFRHSFFYWFANPAWRGGAGLNYSACRAAARVHLHPSGFAVFDCRRIREPRLVSQAGVLKERP